MIVWFAIAAVLSLAVLALVKALQVETYVQHVWRTSRHAERRLKERIDLLESLLLPPGEADPLQEISMDAEQDVEIELAKVREAFRHADRRSRYRHGEGE